MTTAEQLGEWEAAWAGSAEGAGFFKPSLLEDETIGVLAGYEGDRIVAGAIANRSSTVIGLSNVFDVAGDLESAWVGAAAIAARLWGEMTTVSYDSGDSLDAAHRGGFKSIGELVVWLHAQSSPEGATRRVRGGASTEKRGRRGAYLLEIATTRAQFLLPIVTTYLVPGFVPEYANLT